MAETILFGERVEKKDPNDYGWNRIYDPKEHKGEADFFDPVLLGHKSILVFPGDAIYDDEDMNGTCRRFENMLSQAHVLPKDMPHLYSVGYLSGETASHRQRLLKRLGKTQFDSSSMDRKRPLSEEEEYWKPFFNGYILPLIVDQKGRPYSAQQIRQNIQNITIVSHCHGGIFAYQIEKMLQEKIEEFYPHETKDLMSDLRMIHFSSRRPIEKDTYSRNFHIISHEDRMYADSNLEYDSIHEQIHRFPMSCSSMLIPFSKNEEVLVLKKMVKTESDVYLRDYEHIAALHVFSGEEKDTLPRNFPAIKLVQKLLKHFVEHPDDKRAITDILKDFDSEFTTQNIRYGKSFLKRVETDEKIHRGLLSLLGNPNIRMGQRSRKLTLDDNRLLLERNDKGLFLYEELKKNYEKTGDSRSLINFLKGVELSDAEQLKGVHFAIQKRDWPLAKAYVVLRSLKRPKPENMKEIISITPPDDLMKLIYIIKIARLDTNAQIIGLLLEKSKKIKNSAARSRFSLFLGTTLEKMQTSYKSELKLLLKMVHVEDKKYLKSLLWEKFRKTETEDLLKIVRERDQKAKGILVNKLRRFYLRSEDGNIDDFLEFKKEQKISPNLSVFEFMKKRRKERK